MESSTVEIVGLWDHAGLVIRLLQVIDASFQAGPKGLHERGTRTVCDVTMRPTDPAVAARIREGDDPRDPSILESDWSDIDGHHSVLTVRSKNKDARRAASDVLRCGAALVHAGGVAVLCVQSGVAHAGTRWVEFAETAGPDVSLPVLARAYGRWPIRDGAGWRTRGLTEIGLGDVVAIGLADETVALALFDDLVARQVNGATLPLQVKVLNRVFGVAKDASGTITAQIG